MFISGVRLVRETNSSSTHTIYIKDGEIVTELPRKLQLLITYFEEWGEFLNKHEEVLAYFTTQASLLGVLDDFAEALKKRGFEVEVVQELEPHIDHQSVFQLSGPVVGEFLADCCLYVIKHKGGILLSYDGWPEFDRVGYKEVNFSKLLTCGYRVYKNGNYYLLIREEPDLYALYDLEAAEPVRFRVNFNEPNFIPELPEQVDLKITNFCAHNCPFCHESSGPNGEHADPQWIADVFEKYQLPMEVAIGGGNPLDHPALIDILNIFKDRLIGITVKDVDVFNFKYRKLWEKIAQYNVAVGVSPTTVEHTVKAVSTLKNLSIHDIVIHVINRVHDASFIHQLNRKIDIVGSRPVFLVLGYKSFGRGAQYKPPHSGLTLSDLRGIPMLAFDTLALEQIGRDSALIKYVQSPYYTGDEGEYSMYIDAVKKEYAVCSYSDVRYPLRDLREAFQHIRDIRRVILNI